MSEPTDSSEPTVPSVRKPLDWRLLDFITRWLPSHPNPPPIASVRFGLIVGMLEGAFVGTFHGGIVCLIVSPIWGGLVGFICGMFGGKILQHVKSLTLSLLISSVIGAIGAWVIAFYIPMFAWLVSWVPFWAFAGVFLLGMFICIPLLFLLPFLVYREIRAALAGAVVGASIGLVGLTIVGVFIAADQFGDLWVLPVGGLLGAIGGLVDGALVGSIMGAFLGALVNVNRRTFLPTYGGLVGALGAGLAGWFSGRSIAGDAGEAVGVMLGISWGAVVGVKFGALLTPRSWRTLSLKDETGHLSPVIFDMSDGRRLADLADTDSRLLLFMLLIGQIALRTRKLYLGPVGEEYRVTLEGPDPPLDPHPSISLDLGRDAIATLKELTRLEPMGSSNSFRCWERDVQVIVSRSRVDLHIEFDPIPRGEQVTITFQSDEGAADAAVRVCARFLFLLKARRWFSPRGWPMPRHLLEIA